MATIEGRPLVGISFRRTLARDLLERVDEFDVFEVLADHAFTSPTEARTFADLEAKVPIVPHGLELSIGSVDCLEDGRYLEAVTELCRLHRGAFYGDHLAMTKLHGRSIGHLSPLWYTRAQLDVVVRNVTAVQARIGRPLALETITRPFDFAPSDLTEAGFINRMVQETGCGVILDLANLFINAHNLRFDPRRFLEELDLSAVWQLHLAGGRKVGAQWIDSHSSAVAAPVWKLLEEVAPSCGNLRAVILERDNDYPAVEELIADVRRARRIVLRRNLEARCG